MLPGCLENARSAIRNRDYSVYSAVSLNSHALGEARERLGISPRKSLDTNKEAQAPGSGDSTGLKVEWPDDRGSRARFCCYERTATSC